jgi:hypothetical protein
VLLLLCLVQSPVWKPPALLWCELEVVAYKVTVIPWADRWLMVMVITIAVVTDPKYVYSPVSCCESRGLADGKSGRCKVLIKYYKACCSISDDR